MFSVYFAAFKAGMTLSREKTSQPPRDSLVLKASREPSLLKLNQRKPVGCSNPVNSGFPPFSEMRMILVDESWGPTMKRVSRLLSTLACYQNYWADYYKAHGNHFHLSRRSQG